MKIVLIKNKIILLITLTILISLSASFWYLKNQNISVDNNKEILTENIVYSDEEKPSTTALSSPEDQKNIENEIINNLETEDVALEISQESAENESALIKRRKEKRETERTLQIEKYVDSIILTGNIFLGIKRSGTLFLLKIAINGQNQPIIIKVPEDYKSIQLAIENAKEGDIVEVEPGEYQENIIMKEGVSLIGTGKINLIPPSSLIPECFTKEVTETTIEEELTGSPPENLEIEDCNEQNDLIEEVITQDENSTDNILLPEENLDVIINGNGTGNVVTFKNGITNKTTLSGFIIKNSGKSLSGILIEDSSPWIHDNILIDNEFNIYIKGDSAPVIQKNALQFASKGIQVYNFQKEEQNEDEKPSDEEITTANSEPEEPTMPLFSTKPNIIDNLITDNKIGIDLYNSSALINHNTISYNNHYKIYLGATFGIYIINSSAKITNNIISDNGICELCAGINIDAKSKDISISYNNIWNNKNNFVCYGQCDMQENNLSESPQFANSFDGNYFLQKDSGLIGKTENELDIGVRW
ncbi:MAG: hypothetical protein KAI67_02750 [Candidatus Pacebacteria bacterium]|nr:hypothetical protein [Candidatus Paceibacterota bacterium]